ncbi:MAG: hypothetical protein LBV00_11370 [Propionibacteriaceae bacterium]|nr:hypothetical protein [Propionibacteriaceae bacterium]
MEIDRAGQSEKEFLDDDIITPSERERAYLNFVACAAAKGIEIYDYALDPHGGDSFHSRPIGVQSDAPAVPRDTPRGNESEIVERPTSPEETIVQDCRLEHYTAVGLLYSYNHRLTGAKLAQFNEEVAQCMRDQGVDVPKGATEDQMADIDHWVHSDCFTETRDKYK